MKNKGIIIAAVILVLFIAWAELSNPKEYGYIRIDTAGFETTMNLYKSWWTSVAVNSEEGSVKVPAGTYIPEKIKISSRKNDKEWNIKEETGIF